MHTRQSQQQTKDTSAVSQTHVATNQQAPELLSRTAHPTVLIQRAIANPESLNQAEVFQLQRTIGNRAVSRLLRVQPKLTIGQPGDKYEREADRVATQIAKEMTTPINSMVQHQESERRDQARMEPVVQQQIAEGGMAAPPDLEASVPRLRGRGQPLPNTLRSSIGQAMGADFSGVKVHTDLLSGELNQSIQARAFTTGRDIFFRQGEYQPESRGGQELIAHELTHVVQQDPGRSGSQFTSGAIQCDYEQWESGKDQPVLGALDALDAKILAQLSPEAKDINLKDHILGSWEIERINARYNDRVSSFFSSDKGKYLLDLLHGNVDAPKKQLLLLKSYAAGRKQEDITKFATQLAVMSDEDAYKMTTLAPKGKGQKGLAQQTKFFCSPTSIQIFKAHFDPMYALQITQDSAQSVGNISQPDPEKNKFAHAEQARISKQYASDKDGGLEPHERMKAINDLQSVTGVSYCVVDVTEYEIMKNSEGQTTKLPKQTDPAIFARVTKLVRYALSLGLPTGVGITSHAQIMTDLIQTIGGDELALYDPKFARTTWTPGSLMQKGFAKTGSLESEVYNVIIPYLENDKAYMAALAQFGADKVILPAKSGWW